MKAVEEAILNAIQTGFETTKDNVEKKSPRFVKSDLTNLHPIEHRNLSMTEISRSVDNLLSERTYLLAEYQTFHTL